MDDSSWLAIIGTAVVGAVIMYFMFAGGSDTSAPAKGKSKRGGAPAQVLSLYER